MITINIIELPHGVSVRVLRWPPEGRYPAQLAHEIMAPIERESTLAMTQRAAQLAVWLCAELRAHP